MGYLLKTYTATDLCTIVKFRLKWLIVNTLVADVSMSNHQL